MLYRKSTCVNKWNLRRIIAVLLILTIAFDYHFEVHAANDYIGKPVYLFSTLCYNTNIDRITSDRLSDYIHSVCYPTPIEQTKYYPDQSSSQVLYDVMFPIYLRNALIPDGTYHVDFDLDMSYYFDYVMYENSSYEGPFLLDISSIYIDSPDNINAFIGPYGAPTYGSSDNYTGNAFTISSGIDNAIKLRLRVYGDVIFTSGSSHLMYVHIPVYCDYGGLLSDQYGHRELIFHLFPTSGDSNGYTLKDGDRKGESSVPGTITEGREEDREDAERAGDDSKSFVEDALDLENKWEILWYPIKFTNNILSVFTGGTSAVVYQDTYGNIVGYTYNDDLGILEPVIDYSRAISRSGGTIITFPAFTLPVLNVQIWDSYDFDLSTIKDNFSLLFDSLYVAESILEVYWFVGFLRDKYDEVFG